MLDFFWEYRSKWKLIGIELGIKMSTLDAIDTNKRSIVEDCLLEMISKWLHGSNPKSTRTSMNAALQAKCLAGEGTLHKNNPSRSHYNRAILLSYHVIYTVNAVFYRFFYTAHDDKMKYAKYLKSLYKIKTLSRTASSENEWPPPITDEVFNLAMIKSADSERVHRGYTKGDVVREKTISGKVDRVLEKKISIELKDISKECKYSQRVLLEGSPGCGKSTMSLHICHQWSEEQLFREYDLVILIKLRELPIQSANSLSELLPRRDERMGQDIEEVLTSSDGRNVLFVLDGWDEFPKNVPAYPMILNFIKGIQLPESSVIITSRSTSSAILHPLISLRIEILGFTKDILHKYVYKCLENCTKAVTTLLQKIKENPIMEGSCYLPLNASMIVHLFKCHGNKLPTTQYGIFTELVCTCIFRHLQKTQQGVDELKSLDELPSPVNNQFQKLCKIAYDGVMKDQVIFKLDSNYNTLGLLEGIETFVVRGTSCNFNFIHLTLQELLASIHMATLDEKEQAEKFQELFGQPRFSAVFEFFVAKTKLQNSEIVDFVKQVVRECTADDPSFDKALLVSLIRCLHEAQDKSLCQLIANELNLELTFSSLTPADCYYLGYFLTHCEEFAVNIGFDTFNTQDCCKYLFRQGEVYNLRSLK